MIDVENLLDLDEQASVEFVLALRKRWADTVYPTMISELAATGAPVATVADAEAALHRLPSYPWFSHLERSQQKMLWRTSVGAVLRNADELLGSLQVPDGGTAGTLRLDPDLQLPDWYTRYDIHLQPGSFFADDLSAFVYELGARIVMLRDNDGYKFHRLLVETALPDVPDAELVLDMGCGFGKSTRALVAKYPSARIVGVDLAAPGLRLAHAEASAAGAVIDYYQADARDTGLPAASCDVVTGTMLLHELPSDVIVATVNEAARVLKPGGALRFLEFQLTGDPARDVTVLEHAERNDEPYFRELFATDVVKACTEAGLVEAGWSAFDERGGGLQPDGWPARPEWHFPWAVLSATKPRT